MIDWKEMRVVVLGGGGQVGRDICRQLMDRGLGTLIVHDLTEARVQEAIDRLLEDAACLDTQLIPSAGNIFYPQSLGAWELVDHPVGMQVCVPKAISSSFTGADPTRDNDAQVNGNPQLLEALFDYNLGMLTTERIRASLLWQLVAGTRAHALVDTVNTATALGYQNDIIRNTRGMHDEALEVLQHLFGEEALDPTQGGLQDRLEARLETADGATRRSVAGPLYRLLKLSLQQSAFLNNAVLARYVQCLNGLFDPEGGPAVDGGTHVPTLARYVKVHTSGLGGMGFNLRYTHGDTAAPGLSTSLLGKVSAAGSLLQLLQALAHTPGRDVRVVVPATVIGWEKPKDALVRQSVWTWDLTEGQWISSPKGPLEERDATRRIPLREQPILADCLRAPHEHSAATGQPLEVPYVDSGENQPYGVEDMAAITELGQMGCITKEEVAHAAVECLEGDSRYDVLTAMDASLLKPTQSAAVLRDKMLREYRIAALDGDELPRPSISLGNLGPTSTKFLYEIELLRSVGRSVRGVATADPVSLLAQMCSFITGEEGGVLRRQILSIGVPIVMQRGMGQAELLLGGHVSFPSVPELWERPLDLDDSVVQGWLEVGWIDLSYANVQRWLERFGRVLTALEGRRAVLHSWFDPDAPFKAGELLGFYHSITGGARRHYI